MSDITVTVPATEMVDHLVLVAAYHLARLDNHPRSYGEEGVSINDLAMAAQQEAERIQKQIDEGAPGAIAILSIEDRIEAAVKKLPGIARRPEVQR